jgi:hypothetical protein
MATSMVVAAFSGCSHKETAATLSPLETLDAVLEPTVMAEALAKLGGAHFHATAMFRVDGQVKPSDATPLSPPAITTTTDLWIDRGGNFHLAESNDQDGGRDVFRVGGEVSVAMRYGKATRRPAQDTESARFLAEAVGAPWTAWELARRQVDVDASGDGNFRLRLGSRLRPLPTGFAASAGLRKWRDSVNVKTLEGLVLIDPAHRALRDFTCKLTFAASREDVPIAGEVVVSAKVDDVGKVADITMPAAAEALHTRQRTILEERALLGGLGSSQRKR